MKKYLCVVSVLLLAAIRAFPSETNEWVKWLKAEPQLYVTHGSNTTARINFDTALVSGTNRTEVIITELPRKIPTGYRLFDRVDGETVVALKGVAYDSYHTFLKWPGKWPGYDFVVESWYGIDNGYREEHWDVFPFALAIKF